MKLGYNEIMITSKYFNDINDFINLEIGVKRFQGNIERFHFNPIPLNKYSRKLFPNIETFHIYNKKDEIFKDGRIFKQVIWYPVNYSKYLKKKEKWSIYKNIEYTYQDRNTYGTTIPLEVKSLGYKCFKYCSSLTSINIPTTINEIGDCCFYKCKSLKSINIPSPISEIGNRCFEGCPTLTSINIPSSITSIGDGCFSGCSSLTSMNIDNLQFISEKRILMNEPVLVSIKIPENLQIINGKNIEKKDTNEFIIPSSITKLGKCCFYGCSSLKSINLPSSINELGDHCFCGCSSLTYINIPSSINELGYCCFYECTSLTSINIPSSVIELGDHCFYGCSPLISINIPSSISKLGYCCFCYCYSLKSINIPASVSEIGNWCFGECSSLTSVSVDNLQFVSKERIFMNEPELISIKIPDNLEIINGKNIEKKDTNEFIIPSSITKLGKCCFYGCSSLTSINIPTSINELGDHCFYGCSSLTYINIPTSINELGYDCFYKCGVKKN
ncbi:hypothetical protein, conserved [Entamoeba dispar SAW760]|uniref:Leucine rich repeat containing protein BspA family protein n=1 Tax=Entamoeba dispar (strain ATCC PRA-260 / SAW760) TaxID=370354 RepID=B0EKD8_ENTDS|nr:uncharacterized protein EDI_329080 [Entamoeba dispar SAW760]EDR25008.1 hypothetical protein, conserved [Entamoeba dispar SAW760]|eukprot:EDR25008.1 hypothetical protein, conserved [Entamoeba dispar SAW760]